MHNRLGMKRARRLAVILVLWFAVAESTSYGCLYVLRGRLDDDIRRRAEIYATQSALIAAMLSSPASRRVVLDPVVGWRYRHAYNSTTDTISHQGLRARRQYSETPAPGVRRVAAFGDSFVYGNEVADDDSWSALIEHGYPHVEVLNYGVGGYGVDQAYLRYRMEGHRLAPDTMLMGFVADDLRRLVNVYRRFISTSELPLFKPRYVLSPAGELVLLPTPVSDRAAYERYLAQPDAVREVGVHDQWYEPLIYENALYDWSATIRLASSVWIRARRRYLDADRLIQRGQFSETSVAFLIQRRLFRLFADDVAKSGANAIVVFLPDKQSVTAGLAGDRPVYRPLLQATRRDGVLACDLSMPFVRAAEREGVGVLFMPGGHYSRRGNELVAESLGMVLGEPRETRGASGEKPDYCRAGNGEL